MECLVFLLFLGVLVLIVMLVASLGTMHQTVEDMLASVPLIVNADDGNTPSDRRNDRQHTITYRSAPTPTSMDVVHHAYQSMQLVSRRRVEGEEQMQTISN